MQLYKNIKLISDAKNISIAHIEKAADLGNGTINRWDTSYPSIDKVQRVADYLQIPMYLLVSDDITHEFQKHKLRDRPVTGAELTVVIKTQVCIGEGTEDDLGRYLYQYWSLEGKLLAEQDEFEKNTL